MAELKQHALLLSLLLILAVAKFIIVPIFTWQEQLIIENKSLEKRLTKTSKVLNNETEVNELNQQLEKSLVEVKQVFFPYQSDAAFKLSQQQMLEKLFTTYKLKPKNLAWQTETNMKEQDLVRYQLNIRFDGRLVNVIELFSFIESTSPWLEIKDFNISTKGQNGNSLGSVKGGRVSLNLYMHNTVGTEDITEFES